MTEMERAYHRFIIKGGEKQRYRYPLNKDALVFDVGGYEGDFSANIWKHFKCRCFCFEPVKEFAEKIEKRFKYNDDITVFGFGLSDKTMEVPMMISASGSSAVIERDHGTLSTVSMKNISDFFAENDIQHVDLMKLNIEGGEYALLEHMIELNLITKIDYLQIQFHELNGENSFVRMEGIWTELKKTHDLEWAYRPYIHESWKRRI